MHNIPQSCHQSSAGRIPGLSESSQSLDPSGEMPSLSSQEGHTSWIGLYMQVLHPAGRRNQEYDGKNSIWTVA